MAKVIRTITINAPVEKGFGFMNYSGNLPEIWPSMVRVEPVHYDTMEETKQFGVVLRGIGIDK
jgi:hypothetical protein